APGPPQTGRCSSAVPGSTQAPATAPKPAVACRSVALVQIQMLSDVLDQLQGLATVYDSKHEVAFAAGEALGATLGGGLHRCIRAMNLGCEQ
ncbi:TPA: hypothetical protein ACOB7C_006039, partial [Pseudomonas aeruginosa]